MLSQLPPFGLIFVFPLLLSKLFLFPAAHQTSLRKTTISNPFTVGLSWNLSIMFVTQFRTFSPLGICFCLVGFQLYSWTWRRSFSLQHFSFFPWPLMECRQTLWSLALSSVTNAKTDRDPFSIILLMVRSKSFNSFVLVSGWNLK